MPQTIAEIVNDINRLNAEGIRLAIEVEPHDFDGAIAKHIEAAALAENSAEKINPDYYAFSIANRAYAERHKTNDRTRVWSLLEEAIAKTQSAFRRRTHQTYSGTARLLEEMALVIRCNPTEDDYFEELRDALNLIKRSEELYKQAQRNRREIVKDEFVRDRYYRAKGISAMIITLIAERTEDKPKRNQLLTLALDYAQKELSFRLKSGETMSIPLSNAYHTLAVVQSEFARDQAMYDEANRNLAEAERLDGSPHLSSILKLRRAWLEYRRGGNNKSVIQEFFQNVLDDQNKREARWSPAELADSRYKFFELGNLFTEQYLGRVKALFGAK